jgi:two-component system CheB/CheR fusion protein
MHNEEIAEKLNIDSAQLHLLIEELKVSKEEINKRNEELTIINQLLNVRNAQVNISRLYAESIVATIREPILVLNADLHVISANRSFYTGFQTTQQETEGKLIFELGNKQWDIPALRKLLLEILPEHTNIVDYEVIHDFPDLGERIMLLNAKKIFRDSTGDQSILLAMEDITEKRKIERALVILTEELEKKISERTVSLNEANTDLLHSNQNLEQYAYIASHDLQEPLRKIRIFSALLETTYFKDLPESGRALVGKIITSAERMSLLIKGVLNFSKLLHTDSAFTKTSLHTILNDVVSDFELLIAEKGAVITCLPLPEIEAMPMLINQLFYNLVSNSLKFSKPGVAPIITISCRLLSAGEIQEHSSLDIAFPYYEIDFTDNGIGFQQQYADQIFDVFKRLHGIDQFPGTGIGLALCKKIVMRHHGAIYGTSDETNGASFRIILPLHR